MGAGEPRRHARSGPSGSPTSASRRRRRLVSPETARRFRVENRARRNRIGDPVAYELVPGENVLPMQQPDSQVRERARFLDHHVWVTPYRRDERYPAGEYPNQSAGGDGLPRWTAADRNLIDEDVVLWYVFGAAPLPAARGLAGDAGRRAAASSCGRSASSTTTPRSTCRRRTRLDVTTRREDGGACCPGRA